MEAIDKKDKIAKIDPNVLTEWQEYLSNAWKPASLSFAHEYDYNLLKYPDRCTYWEILSHDPSRGDIWASLAKELKAGAKYYSYLAKYSQPLAEEFLKLYLATVIDDLVSTKVVCEVEKSLNIDRITSYLINAIENGVKK